MRTLLLDLRNVRSGPNGGKLNRLNHAILEKNWILTHQTWYQFQAGQEGLNNRCWVSIWEFNRIAMTRTKWTEIELQCYRSGESNMFFPRRWDMGALCLPLMQRIDLIRLHVDQSGSHRPTLDGISYVLRPMYRWILFPGCGAYARPVGARVDGNSACWLLGCRRVCGLCMFKATLRLTFISSLECIHRQLCSGGSVKDLSKCKPDSRWSLAGDVETPWARSRRNSPQSTRFGL